ncbi:MAG TPA: DUF1819 family protein [Tissierellales bacterium]|nr:DUF1819 family protein [Tissierellales bacterium]
MKTSGVNSLKYSAGAVSKGFWFQEFKKYNNLLTEGFNDKEIKKMQENENILLAPSEDYGKKMINEVSKRTKALPKDVYTMFTNLPVSDQKILNILGIMITDRLFFEYMYEVYREKIIIGNLKFDNSDIRIFLKNKSEQNEKVANLTSQTKKRLAGAYRTYLKEANLIVEEKNLYVIKKPILDINLEKEMKSKDLNPYLRVFLGE